MTISNGSQAISYSATCHWFGEPASHIHTDMETPLRQHDYYAITCVRDPQVNTKSNVIIAVQKILFNNGKFC